MSIQMRGYLRELQHIRSNPVTYSFQTDSESITMEDWLGKQLEVRTTGRKACSACGRKVKKLYQSGYCFPCVTTLAECDLCIVKPHECHFDKGTCRDESFGETHCMIPHYVYLAYSSGLKVGLTRKGRQIKRWIDQGASCAVLVAEVPTRKLAGELEMEIAKHIPDKTDWRKMLRHTGGADISLTEARKEVVNRLGETFLPYVLEDEEAVQEFEYPRIEEFEANLTSLSLDKTPEVQGLIQGIKGQYILLDTGVLNVKKFTGYEVQVSVS